MANNSKNPVSLSNTISEKVIHFAKRRLVDSFFVTPTEATSTQETSSSSPSEPSEPPPPPNRKPSTEEEELQVTDGRYLSLINQRNIPILSCNDFEIGAKLGSGSFSNVFDIRMMTVPKKNNPSKDDDADSNKNNDTINIDENDLNSSHHRIVLKTLRPQVLNKPALMASSAADLIKEGIVLSKLNHSSVLSIVGWSGHHGVESYRNGRHDSFYLILERIETTLTQRLKVWRRGISFATTGNDNNHDNDNRDNNDSIDTEQSLLERSFHVLDLAEAIRYLHSQNIIHRDLKPDNIGFDRHGRLKILDFDVARVLPPSSQQHRRHGNELVHDILFHLTQKIGSPRYMSPECALGLPYNYKYDVYSFSLLCHEILTLKKPYAELKKRGQTLHEYVYNPTPGLRPIPPSIWPNEMKQLLCRCWSKAIHERPSMEKMLPMLHIAIRLLLSNVVGNCNKTYDADRSSVPGRLVKNDSIDDTAPSTADIHPTTAMNAKENNKFQQRAVASTSTNKFTKETTTTTNTKTTKKRRLMTQNIFFNRDDRAAKPAPPPLPTPSSSSSSTSISSPNHEKTAKRKSIDGRRKRRQLRRRTITGRSIFDHILGTSTTNAAARSANDVEDDSCDSSSNTTNTKRRRRRRRKRRTSTSFLSTAMARMIAPVAAAPPNKKPSTTSAVDEVIETASSSTTNNIMDNNATLLDSSQTVLLLPTDDNLF